MKTIIVGAGQVGFEIAARLAAEGHDVVVVERDAEALARTTEALDVQGLRGHGARPAVLEEAGITECGMLLAVTDSDEVNIVACINAAIWGPPGLVKVARIRDPGYLNERFLHDERVPLDIAINPERIAADKILRLLRYRAVTEVVDFADGRVLLLGLPIRATSPLAGMRFVDLADRFPGTNLLIGAIHRGATVLIPRGSDVILPGDTAYLITEAERADALLETLGVQGRPIRRVMIAGGSRVGRFLAEDLEQMGVRPKLIEPDPRLAKWLADDLPGTVVLNGPIASADLLEQENVDEMEAFIAASRDEEANVMSALLAMRMGAGWVVAVTNRTAYVPILSAVGIDLSISPRSLAVSSILHRIRRGRVVAVRSLGDREAAEALEFEALPESRIIGKPLREVRIPRNALLAAVLRDEVVIIPDGDTVLQAGDHVIAIAQRSAVPALENALSGED